MEINTLNNFLCKICNKTYSSNSGLWKHNKNKHPVENNNESKNVSSNVSFVSPKSKNVSINVSFVNSKTDNIKCKYCNQIFKQRSSKSRHQQKCKDNEKTINLIEQVNKLEQKINELSQTPNITNNNSNNTTNNNINNNIYHVYSFGDEKLEDILTEKVILKILSMGFNSLQYFIDYVSKHPEFNNIQITNLRSNTAYIVDKVSKMFVPTNQADAVKTLTTDRMDNIMEYHEMYAEKIPQKTDNRLNELKDDFEKNPERHYSDTRYTLYKNSQKFNEVKKKEIKIK